MNKKELAIILSKLKPVTYPDAKLEQYQTDPEIAAHLAWLAYLNQDIADKTIADLGCGNGILGIASLLLGARQAYFIDISQDSINIAKENLASIQQEYSKKFDAIFISQAIQDVSISVDTVLENPPFGIKKKHADKPFLEKAMLIANSIYTLHKIQSDDFIYKLASQHDFSIISITEYRLPIKQVMPFHEKRQYKVKVACWRLNRNI